MSIRTISPREARGMRRGMSLVEVIMAMAILVGVILVLGGFSFKFARATGQAHLVITANEIAAARLDMVKQQQTYDAVGLLGPKDSVVYQNFTSFQLHTDVLQIGGPAATQDFRYVTVTVKHPSMTKVISKSTAIAAF
jgi:prepilin-type N-terminal cleavage/methylation domain-containing protein